MSEAQNPPRQRFYGIDFSGAADPRDALWISEADLEDSTLQIRRSQSAGCQFKGTSREEILGELVDFIVGKPDSVFALDFPFGLPEQVHQNLNGGDWTTFIDDFPDDYANSEDDPDEFRALCAELAGDGERSYMRRETDWRRAGQCPYGIQIRYQTYFGILQVLKPLLEDVQVLPMQERDPNSPWVIETYPAAIFGRLGQYRTGYKGRSADLDKQKERRTMNVQALHNREGVVISDDVQEQSRQSDNALDSVACTYAAYRSVISDEPDSPGGDIEGWIYV